MKTVHAHEPLPMSLPPQYQVGRRNKSCVRVRTKMKNASFHKQYTTSAEKLSLFVHSHFKKYISGGLALWACRKSCATTMTEQNLW
jgi:hypothetical protein